MTNETRTVTRKQFALAAGVSLSTIERLMSAGQLNHLRVGRRVLFAMPRHLEDYQLRFERRVESRRIKIVR
jgi:excisionase family DNA binding protein